MLVFPASALLHPPLRRASGSRSPIGGELDRMTHHHSNAVFDEKFAARSSLLISYVNFTQARKTGNEFRVLGHSSFAVKVKNYLNTD